jgi:hypothetical protein
MAAGLGFKTFTTGEVLTAADTNGYLMQGVLVFASAAARTSAITSPQEGQMSYLKDTNVVEYYSGSTWVSVGGTAALQGCRLQRSSDLTLTSSTYTAVTWNTETYDQGGYHDNSTNTDRITIPTGKDGYYRLEFGIPYYSGATANRITRLKKNGSVIFIDYYGASNANENSPYYNAITGNFVAGDYFVLEVYVGTASSPQVLYGSNTAAGYFSATLLGS